MQWSQVIPFPAPPAHLTPSGHSAAYFGFEWWLHPVSAGRGWLPCRAGNEPSLREVKFEVLKSRTSPGRKHLLALFSIDS